MAVYALGEDSPRFGPGSWIADNATVIGRVRAGRNVSVWYNVVIRSDNDIITIGDDTNIQDGSILHCDFDIPLTIGNRVSIGHQAMVHGCSIGDSTLIGINAVVLNHARVGRGCIIGANTLIPENKEIPDYSLVVGSPGRIIRTLSEDDVARIDANAKHYVENVQFYSTALKAVSPQSVIG